MSGRQRDSDAQPRAAGSTRDVAGDPSDPEPQGDEDALLQAFNGDLTRSVAHAVFTATDTINDACAFAWTRFLRHQPDRDLTVRAGRVGQRASPARAGGAPASRRRDELGADDASAPSRHGHPNLEILEAQLGRRAVRLCRGHLLAVDDQPLEARELKASGTTLAAR